MKRMVSILAVMVMAVAVLVLIAGNTSANDVPEITLDAPTSGVEEKNYVSLEWTCTDADGDDLTYDVYLDTNEAPTTKVASDVEEMSYELDSQDVGPTYYWKVVAKDGTGESSSEVWNFSLLNSIPEVIMWYPDDWDDLLETYGALVWRGFDDDDDELSYEVFLDTNADPETSIGNTTKERIYPEKFTPGTTYYWKVVASDGTNTTESETLQFQVSSSAVEFYDPGTYGFAKGTSEAVTYGGTVYTFEGKKDDYIIGTGSVVNSYKFDFYIVKGKDFREWAWGGENDTFPALVKKENVDSVNINYQLLEDGVYCIIFDDTGMGGAPAADDPDTAEIEVMTISYDFEFKKKSSSIFDPDGDGDSSDAGIIAYIVLGLMLSIPILTIVWTSYQSDTSKKLEAKIAQMQSYDTRAAFQQQQQGPGNKGGV